jgi:hypothetical protein
MTVIKIKKAVNVESLYGKVVCPECHKQYGFHLRNAITRKTCPCAHATFVVTVTPMRGFIQITCAVTKRDTSVVEAEVRDVEIFGNEPVDMEDNGEIDE